MRAPTECFSLAFEMTEATIRIRYCALFGFALAMISSGASADAPHRPGQAHPSQMETVHSNVPADTAAISLKAKRPPAIQEVVDSHPLAPHAGPGPVRDSATYSAKNARANDFVSGHAALNPQPIPPGRVWRRPPRPITLPSQGAHSLHRAKLSGEQSAIR